MSRVCPDISALAPTLDVAVLLSLFVFVCLVCEQQDPADAHSLDADAAAGPAGGVCGAAQRVGGQTRLLLRQALADVIRPQLHRADVDHRLQRTQTGMSMYNRIT